MNLVKRLLEEIDRRCRYIVVVGDIMFDNWVHGHVAECQDHCRKFVGEPVVKVLGGAGNAFSCLTHWNVMKSVYGQHISERPNKWRFVDKEGIVFRYDDELLFLDESRYMLTYKHMEKAVKEADAVLISDYDKGFLSPELIRKVINTCNELKIPCISDAKRDPDIYFGSLLKVNEDWWNKHQGRYHGHPIITRGANWPAFVGHELNSWQPDPLQPVNCVNHVGAGDCFAAHLTLALAYGFSLGDAATLAHSAGRVYVQFPHNRPPRPIEIENDLGMLLV